MVTHPEPAVDQINREFPDAEAFTSNGMCYAKLAGIIIIAAAPSTGELREQIRDYFSREHRLAGVSMDNRNNSAPGMHAARDGRARHAEARLRVLSEMLEGLGLDTRLGRYRVDGIEGVFCHMLAVSNPADPDRGVAHVEEDGCLTWEFSGTLDDKGLARIAGEVTSALRATAGRGRRS